MQTQTGVPTPKRRKRGPRPSNTSETVMSRTPNASQSPEVFESFTPTNDVTFFAGTQLDNCSPRRKSQTRCPGISWRVQSGQQEAAAPVAPDTRFFCGQRVGNSSFCVCAFCYAGLFAGLLVRERACLCLFVVRVFAGASFRVCLGHYCRVLL